MRLPTRATRRVGVAGHEGGQHPVVVAVEAARRPASSTRDIGRAGSVMFQAASYMCVSRCIRAGAISAMWKRRDSAW